MFVKVFRIFDIVLGLLLFVFGNLYLSNCYDILPAELSALLKGRLQIPLMLMKNDFEVFKNGLCLHMFSS